MSGDRSDKAREVATYRKLGLNRETKSARRRESIQAPGLYRFVGGHGPERPIRKVLRSEYDEAWRIANEKNATHPNPNAAAREIENHAYDLIASWHEQLEQLELSFRAQNNRGMTPKERHIYRKLQQQGTGTSTPAQRAKRARHRVVHSVIRAIESNTRHQPERLQQAWATLVGHEAAMQTYLESIDEKNGVAICRCLSSTLAHSIRRNRNLPAQLSTLLGMPIKKILFR